MQPSSPKCNSPVINTYALKKKSFLTFVIFGCFKAEIIISIYRDFFWKFKGLDLLTIKSAQYCPTWVAYFFLYLNSVFIIWNRVWLFIYLFFENEYLLKNYFTISFNSDYSIKIFIKDLYKHLIHWYQVSHLRWLKCIWNLSSNS